MEDIRSLLYRNPKVPQVNRRSTGYVTVHYNGPSVANHKSDLELIKFDARYHGITKDWDGLAYHFAVGRDGKQYQTRDWSARLNHSGVTQGNNESLAVFVATGEGDVIPPEQYASLENLLLGIGIKPRFVLGHQEWPRATACPGALLMRWLRNYRKTNSWQEQITTKTRYAANVRDEADVLSLKVGSLAQGATVKGRWVLGKPVKGDCLWLELADFADLRYIHGSVLDTSSYR